MRVLGVRLNPAALSYVSPKLQLRKIRNGESGLFAIQGIHKGEIVTISAGIGLPAKTARRLPAAIKKYSYFMENGFVYAALTRKVSPDWLMNHSCNPNAGSPREAFTIRALRDIKAGEEICYDYESDYQFSAYRPFRTFKCRCGTQTCRGIIRY